MRKKILIIEDDTIVRENTAEILQLANYEVLTAENGKTGIDKAVVFKPDLINVIFLCQNWMDTVSCRS